MRTLLSTSVMQGNDKEIENCDIELEHVTFRYNTKDVIKDVTCKIPQGSITALVSFIWKREKYNFKIDCKILGYTERYNSCWW